MHTKGNVVDVYIYLFISLAQLRASYCHYSIAQHVACWQYWKTGHQPIISDHLSIRIVTEDVHILIVLPIPSYT